MAANDNDARKAQALAAFRAPHPPKETWRHIGNHVYLVRTQGGFRRALNHFGMPHCEPTGSPASYPAIVSLFYVATQEQETVACRSLHANKVLAAIWESEHGCP